MNTERLSLCVIVPTYNEEAGIAQTVCDLRAALPGLAPDWELRIVDDGSADGTVAAAGLAAEGDPRITVQRERHQGKGGAVRAGMLATRAELRFLCDADLSMPPAHLARFLELVPDACDIAIGSREAPGARRIGEPAYRHVMGRAFNWLVRATVKTEIDDTQCGFKLFSGRAADAVFPHVRSDGWAFDVEVLALARATGFRIREVPIDWYFRPVSRVRPVRDTIGMTRDLMAIRRRLRQTPLL